MRLRHFFSLTFVFFLAIAVYPALAQEGGEFAGPMLQIISPKEGEIIVGDEVLVKIKTNGFTITSPENENKKQKLQRNTELALCFIHTVVGCWVCRHVLLIICHSLILCPGGVTGRSKPNSFWNSTFMKNYSGTRFKITIQEPFSALDSNLVGCSFPCLGSQIHILNMSSPIS